MSKIIKNIFSLGRMNKDADERLVEQGAYRDALNIDVNTSEGGDAGVVRNKKGTTKVSRLSDISGRGDAGALTIGKAKLESDFLIYWCVAADLFDGIYEYNSYTGTTTRVLQANKPNATTPSKLNFSKGHLITGINVIVGGGGTKFLAFTDDYNEPRLINIERCKTYAIDDSRIDSDIDVALVPPLFAPSIELKNDEDSPESNNLDDRFLYFAYRFKYLDDRYSSISPFSPVAFMPESYDLDAAEGINKSMVNAFNSVEISMESGSEFVEEVQLLMRDTRRTNVVVVQTFNKDKDSISDDTTFNFFFNNSKNHIALEDSQVTRLFDNVPLKAKAQAVVGNRVVYGNYLQFRDIIDSNGKDIKIDFTLGYQSNDETAEDEPHRTWRSDRDREYGLIYLDDKGRMTTPLVSKTNTLYIPDGNSDTSNRVEMTINSKAPNWATHFRIAAKQKRGDYYNIFPVLFYSENLYRYFYINKSDIDKVSEGDDLIFKVSGGGPTYSNKEYKVLEITSKASDFIVGNDIVELPGAYIKIKVDDDSEFDPNDLFTYSHTGTGTNLREPNFGGNVHDGNLYGVTPAVYPPLEGPQMRYIDNPIHYGDGDASALIIEGVDGDNTKYYGNSDFRFTIEILTDTTFRYTKDPYANSGWSSPVTISDSTTAINHATNTLSFNIRWNTDIAIVPGDKWKINCRNNSFTTNYYGGQNLMLPGQSYQYEDAKWGGSAVLFDDNFTNGSDKIIRAGARIIIAILEDTFGTSQGSYQELVANREYANIEEWFNEDPSTDNFAFYNKEGVNIGKKAVTFRRALYWTGLPGGSSGYGQISNPFSATVEDVKAAPVYMLINGYGYDTDGALGRRDPNEIRVFFSIAQSEFPLMAETSPVDTDADIYHELSQTYEVVNGNHIVNWNYNTIEQDLYTTYPDGVATSIDVVTLTNTSKDRPHYFNVGDTVEIVNSSTGFVLSGEVSNFSDRYTLSIVGSGYTDPINNTGEVRFLGTDDQSQDGDFTPAIISLNHNMNSNTDFDAFGWGNGVESYRIKDEFNSAKHLASLRATTVIDNYRQVRSESSICYSGPYREKSSFNRLNEFNLSLSNFKDLTRSFGSIQLLHERDADLFVAYEDRFSSLLFGKNILFDAVGGGTTTSVNEVFGIETPLKYENGISTNPESFDVVGDVLFCTDSKRGVVLQINGNRVDYISNIGMNDYFRDLMRGNDSTLQKHGSYDPYDDMYVLHSNEKDTIGCNLEVFPQNSFVQGQKPLNNWFLFDIQSDGPWTLEIQDAGDGTDWVELPSYFQGGYGSSSVHGNVAANYSGSTRSVSFVITYCNTTVTHTLTQGIGAVIDIVNIVNGQKPNKYF